MNLEKMTKVELIDLIKEQKHLAEAVEAKDAEIVKLNGKIKQVEKTVHELNDKLQEQKHLAEAVEAKDLEITSLKNQMAREIEKEKHGKAVYLLEQYILAFRSLMQANRGTLDNAIALDNLLREKIKE